MAIVTLLNWCSVNGIRIHPNLRLIHDEKMGICIRAANYPIMSDQSRKRFPITFYTLSAIFAAAFPTIDHYASVFSRGCQLS
jgi:hypothetical protein